MTEDNNTPLVRTSQDESSQNTQPSAIRRSLLSPPTLTVVAASLISLVRISLISHNFFVHHLELCPELHLVYVTSQKDSNDKKKPNTFSSFFLYNVSSRQRWKIPGMSELFIPTNAVLHPLVPAVNSVGMVAVYTSSFIVGAEVHAALTKVRYYSIKVILSL